MSTDNNPHPWSREGWNHADTPPDEPTVPLQPAASQPPAQPTGAYAPPSGAPSSAPYPPPSPFGAPTTTTTPPRTKGRSRLAGALAVAVLAAGVGGGAGFAASQLATGGTPAITSGNATQVVQADPSNPNWTAVAAAASKAVVAIDVVGQSGASQGSGVVIDTAGHIVTNNHVVSGSGNAQLTVLLGNVSYTATVVGTDPSTDLAVIKLTNPPSDLATMNFGDAKALKVGDPVMAIGNPLGLADTVTTGIVSALNRPVTTQAVTGGRNMSQGSDVVVTAAIQTNAAINPGNSGGALVNTAGELVGITSSIASLSSGEGQAGNIGIGFAIGVDQVQYVAEQLIANGVAQHPQLGVTARDVGQTGQQGAVVASVVADTGAARAGLREGDLITAVDGQPVTSTESLVALVRAGRVGQAMELTLVRDGAEQKVTVTPTAAAR
ncbi:MAG: trypsin-like peptidase domain-containing protein [Tessaracoccus sp.]|uniref:S1C family serine protease n=1 Tax=Tessaracoccus sp. TaxID=1971211 RepID=UPI001EC2892B|nr:trypsin-like peptidase domain-containing protein [Tessaracoccus sp.]MBK7822515.1 trypsin-like peptidase domain-containing protein [Tessaracoccus sp.]